METDAATDNGRTDGLFDAHERPYGVVLDVFEGPLDLLLYLIRKNEVDIYDIPISAITAQYLSVIGGQLRLLDIEVASGFILMAATLMKIKSQILLPRDIEPGMEDEEGDPREELIRRLLEYQQFKEIAYWLGEQGLERRDVFPPSPGPGRAADGTEIHPVSLFVQNLQACPRPRARLSCAPHRRRGDYGRGLHTAHPVRARAAQQAAVLRPRAGPQQAVRSVHFRRHPRTAQIAPNPRPAGRALR